MYRAIYKCRLCQSIIEKPVGDGEARRMADWAVGANPFIHEEDLREIHRCANGSRGISDLLGFRFYGKE